MPPATDRAMTARQREKSPIRPEDIHLDESKLEEELALLFSQYLESHNPRASNLIKEEILGVQQSEARRAEVAEVERAILDGDYGDIETLLSRSTLLKPQAQKAFLYLCYRQQFLEHIENRESQKAFNLLQKRLKPLEHYQPVPYDFFNLAYLTSAGTVHDAPSFRDWAGSGPERERLVGTWKELAGENGPSIGGSAGRGGVPADRLRMILRQAGAWQVQNARRRGRRPWTIASLMTDYHVSALPTTLTRLVEGHMANVKCVDFVEEDGRTAVSGSSDGTLRVFSTETGDELGVLEGHTSRIWDCATNPSASLIASASGDGTIRIWSPQDYESKREMTGQGGDVYGVAWRPSTDAHIVGAYYDPILRLWDVETGQQVRTFSGHGQSTLAVAFDQTGNVIASGSKDKHIRLWDAVGGVCAQTMTACLGEITSVEFDSEGKYLLAGCKDNSNRLWDLRMQRNLYRYTGHQNTSKNLIRCSFAQDCSMVIGGSEDGLIYLWEREGGGDSSSHAATIPPSTAADRSRISPHAFALPLPSSPIYAANANGNGLAPNTTQSAPMRSSPAYYPPKDARQPITVVSSGTNVRPLKALEGHADGAVFDVQWTGGVMISGGEDGCVGIWEVRSDFDEADDPEATI